MSMPKPSHKPEASKGLQMLRDPRIGKQAAVCVGHLKGYEGRLLDISRDKGTIELVGRQLNKYTASLNYFVLL